MAFRRRRKDSDPAETESLEHDDDLGLGGDDAYDDEAGVVGDDLDPEDPDADDWPREEQAARTGGPWDADEAPEDKIDRVDLGGIRVPIIGGMELRAEIADERVVAATLIVERSALQIQPFAAPRTMGIWGEVREEIAAGIRSGGGQAEETTGRFGTELVAEVPVALPDGTAGTQLARFIGVDGPRWFLRAVITGEAAVEERVRGPLEGLLAEVVVVRGPDPMAPRDPIELRLPEDVEAGPHGEAFDADAQSQRSVDDLKPFERGPEITERR